LVVILILINLYGLDLYYRNDSKNNDYRPIMESITNSIDPGDKIFVYPYYYGWILDYYKETGEYPKLNNIDYGWKFSSIVDSVKNSTDKQFWFILDHHSFDTSSYHDKISSLSQESNLNIENTFFIQPQKVELFKVVRK
jgi:hypothetical protein